MFTLFVSHQWLGFHHPDPNAEQLNVLQLVLKKLIAKQMTIQADLWSEYNEGKATTKDLDGVGKWHMWLDYFCVPQMVGLVCVEMQKNSSCISTAFRVMLTSAAPSLHWCRRPCTET